MDSMNTSEGNESSGEVDATPISVVHVSLQNQPIQVTTVGSDGDNAPSNDEDAETRKRREILARRPSYRKILNDLSSEPPPGSITVTKIEEESNGSTDLDSQDGTLSGATVQYHTAGDEYQKILIPAGALQVAAAGDGHQGLQTLTMTNASSTSTVPTTGATIVQYAQGPDGQFFIPAGNVQYQIAPSTLPQGVVMAATGTTIASPQQIGEEASRKRELRLLKNREAARECRRKKKEYVKCLENRVAVLENQNKTLIEELKSLKELYCQKEAQS